jgi:hypothetical protein
MKRTFFIILGTVALLGLGLIGLVLTRTPPPPQKVRLPQPATTLPADSPPALKSLAVVRTAPEVDQIPVPAPNEVPVPDAERDRQVIEKLPAAAPVVQAPPPPREAFSAFPVGKARTIDFLMGKGLRDRLTPREQADQLRDWLLAAVVSDANLDVDSLNKVLFDLPLLRHGYLRPVANFEYGVTRSCFLPDNQVVALVPRPRPGQEAQRKDHLAHIADEHRKNAGYTPAAMLVFEYDLDVQRGLATVTRKDRLDGADLFKKDYGYQQGTIASLGELKKFLAEVDDVTFSSFEEGKLVLGGRKLLGRRYRGIRLEDVAAIWQAQADADKQLEEFVEKPRREFVKRWTGVRARSKEELERLQLQAKEEGEALKKSIAQTIKEKGLVPHLGFSLDTKFDHARLRAHFARTIEPRLRKLLGDPALPLNEEDIRGAKAALDRDDESTLLGLLHRLTRPQVNVRARTTARALANGLFRDLSLRYQEARYDGRLLRGTEVGMVMFYTDLLEKLWALNYAESTPRDIPDFRPATHVILSPAYARQEAEHPGTRIWFAPDERNFQFADEKATLLFARNATRLFSASSNQLRPTDEVPPGPSSEAFDGWWNDHFEEVARYEPEYERLNQVMKWTTLVVWLNGTPKGGSEALSFLRDVRVKRDLWFPQWMKAYPELKFKRFDSIKFFPKPAGGPANERMPILRSPSWDWMAETPMSGGVPLPGKASVEARIPLPRPTVLPEWVPTRGVNPKSLVEGRGRSLQTVRRITYQFERTGPGRASTRATLDVPAAARSRTKLRAREAELAGMTGGSSTSFVRTVEQSRNSTSLRAEVDFGGTVRPEIGAVTIRKKVNGFGVEFHPRDVDKGHALVRKLSSSGDPARILGTEADVEAFFGLGNGQWLVKLHDCRRWLKIGPEAINGADVAPGWQSRVAGTERAAKTLNMAWRSQAEVVQEMGDSGWIVVTLPGGADQRVSIAVHARGPPAGGHEFTISGGGGGKGPGGFKGPGSPAAPPPGGGKGGGASGGGKGGGPGGGSPPRPPASGGGGGKDGWVDPLGSDPVDRGKDRLKGTRVVPKGGPPADVRAELYLRVSELPEGLRANPERLADWFPLEELPALRNAVLLGKGRHQLRDKPPAGSSPLVDALLAGDRAEAGRLIAADPWKARQELAHHHSQGERRVRRYLDERQYGEAVLELEQLIAVHGRQPELLARLGVVEILRERSADAARILEDSRLLRRHSLDVLFSESSRYLRDARLPAEVREDLGRLGRFADFKRAVQSTDGEKKGPQGEMFLSAGETNRLLLEYRMREVQPGPQRHVGPYDQRNRRLIYYEDDPALAKAVSSPGGLAKTLKGLDEGKLADLYKLQSREVVSFEPDEVRLPESVVKGRLLLIGSTRRPPADYRPWGDPNAAKDGTFYYLVRKKGRP